MISACKVTKNKLQMVYIAKKKYKKEPQITQIIQIISKKISEICVICGLFINFASNYGRSKENTTGVE